jgi:hypothetical protein
VKDPAQQGPAKEDERKANQEMILQWFDVGRWRAIAKDKEAGGRSQGFRSYSAICLWNPTHDWWSITWVISE